MSAAEMIKRFREGKPTSQEERARQREREGKARMWYETDENSDREGADLDDSDRPRVMLSVDPAAQPSKPSPILRSIRQPADFMDRTTGSSVGMNTLFKGTSLGLANSLDVNDLIENEIRQLENEVKDQDRGTMARLSLGSFDPTRSIDRSSLDSPAGFRFGKPSGAGAGAGAGGPGRGPNAVATRTSTGSEDFPYAMRRSGGIGDGLGGGFGGGRDSLRIAWSPTRGELMPTSTLPSNLLRSSHNPLMDSVDTLGSTGFKGLLVPELKLDGKVEKKVEEPGSMGNLNADLEELLKKLNEGKDPRSGYFPDFVDESIPQITNKLHAQMLEFQTLFSNKHRDEDAVEDDLKKREESLREEGRTEQRKQQLLELDAPASHPLEYMGVWDGHQMQPIMKHQRPLDYFPPAAAVEGGGARAAGAETGLISPPKQSHPQPQQLLQDPTAHSSSEQDLHRSPFLSLESLVLSPDRETDHQAGSANGSGDPSAESKEEGGRVDMEGTEEANIPALPTATRLFTGLQQRPFAQGVGMVQAAVDVEMGAADSVLAKMRALRQGLGERMRHLDALHASIGIGSQHGAAPSPAIAAAGRGGGGGAGAGVGVVPSQPVQGSWAPHSAAAASGGPGAAASGLPLYARPGGPPLGVGRLPPGYPHQHPSQWQAHGPRSHETAVFPSSRPNPFLPGQFISSTASDGAGAALRNMQQNPYWGLEDYYAHLYEDWLAATEDTRKMWNPYPDLVHENVLSVSKGISSALDSAMNILQHRLPVTDVQGPGQRGRDDPSPLQPVETASSVPQVLRVATAPMVEPPTGPELPSNLDAVIMQRQGTKTVPSTATAPNDESTTTAAAHEAAADLVHHAIDVATKHVGDPSTAVLPAVATSSSSSSSSSATAAAPISTVLRAATAPTVPAPAVTTKDALAELDGVLGIDDGSVSNGLDRFLPAGTAGAPMTPDSAPDVGATPKRALLPKPIKLSSPTAVADAVVEQSFSAGAGVGSTTRNQCRVSENPLSNPHLAATDAYLQARYPPSAWDPRVQYAARRQQRLQAPPVAPSPGSTVVVGSNDETLRQHSLGSGGRADMPSAPPIAVMGFNGIWGNIDPDLNYQPGKRNFSTDFSNGRNVTFRETVEYQQQSQNQPFSPHSRRGTGVEAAAAVIEAAHPLPMVRPLEGTALLHARTAAAAVTAASTSSAMPHTYGQHYASVSQQGNGPDSPSPSLQQWGRYGAQSPDNRHPYSTGAVSGDTSIHEKESYLRRMQKLRQNFLVV